MYIYPRLSRAVGRALLEDLEAVVAHDPAEITGLIALEHPRAAPVATGGAVADSYRIRRVRDVVAAEMDKWLTREQVARKDAARFDRQLAAVLHEHLDIMPSDAAHEGPWTFLTLVVFPDLAYRRFPDLHPDRFLGTPRNALRRAWTRQEILGDLLHEGDPPLGEDELVGIFERSAMVRNRPLARTLTRAVLSYDGGMARSEFARELYKRVRFTTGPLLLDVLDGQALQEHVGAIADRIRQ